MKKYFIGAIFTMLLISLSTQESLAQCIQDSEGKWVSIADPSQPCPNAIVTAVPFLNISTDARASGLGDAGIALSADANSLGFNDSKLVFAEQDLGFGLSYTPWFRNINITDMYLANLSGYKKLDKLQAIGGSIRFFSFGQINFTNANGEPIGTGNPQEAEMKLAYARKLSDKLSAGFGAKFIYSNLAANQQVNGQDISAGLAGAVDISTTYMDEIEVGKMDADLTIALSLRNMGSKITYLNSSNDLRDYLPANMGLGTALNLKIDQYNELAIIAEFNKLMVPTPCLGPDCDANNNVRPDYLEYNPIEAMLKSFSDSPNGFAGELAEITTSLGLEYLYNQQFALRGGYFYESQSKGARSYATAGLGFKYTIFEINMSYLISLRQNNSPLAGTFRFGILFNLGERD